MGLLAAVACTPARREVRTDIVRRIRFEGNGTLFSGNNDLQLRTAMDQKQSPTLTFTFPFMYFQRPVTLDVEMLKADSHRLELWYAHHGWFDARFDGWEIRRARAASPKRAGVVDVLGHVDPGAPSYVRAMRLDVDDAAIGTLARSALQELDLQPARVNRAAGDPKTAPQFNLGAVREAQEAVLETLRNHGYAYAAVAPSMDAFPDEHAVDVVLDVSSGRLTRFGEVHFDVELPHVEPEIVLDSLTFDFLDGTPGDGSGQYEVEALRESQQRLFDTGLFSLVDVRPDLSDPTAEHVPIRINLREAKFRSFRVAAGLEYDYFLLTPQLGLTYRDLRLGGSKLQAKAGAGVGAVIGINQRDTSASTPWYLTARGDVSFDYPWLLRRKLALGAGAYIKRDLQFGSLPYWTFGGDFRARVFLKNDVQLGVGPRFEYFSYFSLGADQVSAALTQFGPDFTSTSYRLLSVDASLVVDWRDDPLSPHRGSYGAIDLRQSIPIPSIDGGDTQPGFLYTRIDADLRGWVPFRTSKKDRRLPFVFAGRAHGRLLVPWRGEDDALPYPDLAFLGGPNSLRGFRTNMVGAYDLACLYAGGRPVPAHNNGDAYDVDLTYLPRGGALALEGAAELRYDWQYGLSLAAFGDVGLLARRAGALGTGDVVQDMLRFSGGVGLRYASPIGPIRIDIGLRPLFVEDTQGPGRTFGCNARDVLPRGFDLFSSSVAARERLQERGARDFPVGINLFLAIGEAF